jgi:hypothetical protein
MKNSPHKQRLVDAMLTDDNRAHSVSCASLAEPSGFGNTYLFGAGISIFCAVAMFLVLCGRDKSLLSAALISELEQQRTSAPPAAADSQSAPRSDLATSAGRTAIPDAVQGAKGSTNENVQSNPGTAFKLTRSRKFQDFGSLGLKLLRVNLRRGNCDVVIKTTPGYAVQRRLRLHKTVQIAQADGPSTIEVTEMKKNEVSVLLRDSRSSTGAAGQSLP